MTSLPAQNNVKPSVVLTYHVDDMVVLYSLFGNESLWVKIAELKWPLILPDSARICLICKQAIRNIFPQTKVLMTLFKVNMDKQEM